MSIRARILAGFALITCVAFCSLVRWVRDDLRLRYLESVEEVLVDTANLLAALVARDLDGGGFPPSALRDALDEAGRRTFRARIYGQVKTHVDLRVTITDECGIVVFDSEGGQDEGRDNSRWNDVHRTLHGMYGARATRRDPSDPTTTVLYVAAPIQAGGSTAGVLTVCKPTDGTNVFLEAAKRKVAFAGGIAALATLALGAWVTIWVTRPVRRLTGYARAVARQERVSLPDLGGGEIGTLGRAFEEMRAALDGHRQVEAYVQALTHELKSPLSAIRASAELLKEEVPAERRERFLGNILVESKRIQSLVDRLLELSALESRRGLQEVEAIDLTGLLREVQEGMQARAEAAGVRLTTRIGEPMPVRGERFLVLHAVENLLQNALEFTPRGGEVAMALRRDGDTRVIEVSDSGPGVPPFALPRVFERFYSLPRPGGLGKSTGLGLAFVQEIASLHGGTVTLENRPEGGARATLRLPARPPISR